MTIELLREIRLIDPVAQVDRPATVLLDQGQVRAIDPDPQALPEGTQVIEAAGQILAPGLVDCYSRSGEPGHESRETLASLAAAALAGGFTTLALLPNTQPAMDQPALVQNLRDRWAALPEPSPHLHLWGALTQGAQGEQMSELAELATAGIVGFTDGRSIRDWVLMERLLDYAGPLGLPLMVMGQSTSASRGPVLEGVEALRLGVVGVSAVAESSALATLLELLRDRPARLHVMRLATGRAAALVAQGKADGLPLTASLSWLQLLCDTSHIDGRRLLPGSDRPPSPYDPSLHLSAPLGNPADRQALIAALKAGTIDAIAVDHAPYTYEEKTVAFAEAPKGAIGLELALPLLWSGLVMTGELTALELWRSLSQRPAELLGQTPQPIGPGQAQPLIRFDPAATWTVEPAQLRSLAQNTPWLGHKIAGRVVQTWLPT